MKALYYFLGILLYAFSSTLIKYAGYILGAIPTMILFSLTVILFPRLLIRHHNTRLLNKKCKKLSKELNIPIDIPAHCESVENNDLLNDYLQTCVEKSLITQEQYTVLFEAYKQ